MVIEQFDFVQVVLYASGVRFAYDMRTTPPSLLGPFMAIRLLTEFATANHGSVAAIRATEHAQALV